MTKNKTLLNKQRKENTNISKYKKKHISQNGPPNIKKHNNKKSRKINK